MKKMMLLGFLVLTLVSIFFCAQVCAEGVIVEKDDSFWKIAKRHNVSWVEIQEINRDELMYPGNFDLIYPGQFIRLPSVKTDKITMIDLFEVVVEKNDSFWKIAKNCNVSWDELKRMNHDRLVRSGDFDLIYPGQVLKLPVEVGNNISAAGSDANPQEDNIANKEESWLEMEVVESQQLEIKDAEKVEVLQVVDVVQLQQQAQEIPQISTEPQVLQQAPDTKSELQAIVSNVSISHAEEDSHTPDIPDDSAQKH